MNLNAEEINVESINFKSKIYYKDSTINNVTGDTANEKSSKIPYNFSVSDWKETPFDYNFNDTFPTYLTNCETIAIPKRVKRNLERLPKSVLSKIDSDKSIAVEKCLDFVSNLTGTIFYDSDEDKWKNLHSTYLDEKYRKGKDNTRIYKRVIDALTYSTDSTFPVIEVKKNEYGGDTYLSNEYSKSYRLNELFAIDKIDYYILKNNDFKQKIRKNQLEKLSKAINNKIGNNLLNVYKSIELPTLDEIKKEGDKLINKGYVTKKGKRLAKINKRKKENIKDYKNLSFVEDNISRFKYLTQNGLITPSISSKAGGRVTDSFNLMPSYIRNLVKIDGERIIELDFKALHPNLAIKIYGGKSKYTTHQNIANFLNEDIKKVKIEHLSFFNKHPNDMKKSVLHQYYMENESEMLENILNDKLTNRYKITSMRLFDLEVQIMTQIISELNKKGIYVLYVYDALLCKESQTDVVLETMNRVILDNGVYTIACV
jgi:hypothetical protein